MNLAHYLSRAARQFGDKAAAIDGERQISFRKLEERSNRLAHALSDRGVPFQACVAIVLPNSIEWMEAEFGIAKIGAVTVPVAPRLHEQEMARMINAAEPAAVITNGEILERLKPHLTTADTVFFVVGGPASGKDCVAYEEALSAASSELVCVDVDEFEHGRVLRFTSGSTGQPKGVFLTHRNWMGITNSMLLDRCYLYESDIIFNCGGFSHAGGLWIMPAAIRGATLQIKDTFDAEMIVRHIEEGKATVVQLSPTVLRRILDVPEIAERNIDALRVMTYSGSPIDSVTLADALAIFGNRLVQSYGANEAAAVTVMSPKDHAGLVGYSGWQQPLGRETALAEVKIADKDGKALPVGEIGEMAIRGPMVFRRYWRDPELTEKAFRDGWYYSGDLAMRGENGLLYMSGRSKDIIITGGYNVVPREVERVLESHAVVQEAAVVGIAHRDWGEQVTAFVRLKPGAVLAEDALIDYCRDEMTFYKKPKRIHFLDEMPRNVNGKIDRETLRKHKG
jgi:acyl-CoA synthetase (AMP-forming)/AMP-acid ligase II